MKLFIPGPVEVRKDLLEVMSDPMIGHRSPEFSELYDDVVSGLQSVMQTDNDVFISTSSATGLLEASVRNTVDEKCLNISNGAFGDRWHEITMRNGKDCRKLEFDWGEPVDSDVVAEAFEEEFYDVVTLVHNESSTGLMNPVKEVSKVLPDDTLLLVDTVSSMGGVDFPVDEYGVDICVFGTQKCMGLPPGLAFCSVSEDAVDRSEVVGDKGYYFSFDIFRKYNGRRQTPTTPNISLLYALEKQLDYIVNEEGVESRWERHSVMANETREWAREHFDVFPASGYESESLTAVENTRDIDVGKLISRLKDKGYVISNGYGDLREETFRIGHLADRQPKEVTELLNIIEEILDL
ncbi:Serine-pyruvate aminotransferase/archaeal aspartate aminotransferase PucG [Methanonatronarchaeum thermophilum]|uniref:Serine-pyruvate aminotransferase/archaeal aspartate aminotransferase PucG n=1 Tax=Methanonatronarchaeum thermophilum TaxID=1927129 RepID=A0A1Y3GHV5_9EURY|nr:alanine--glyoxylate aminotransferase family protein [Methanonatronarchaeum thermophilum]OUJ19015.1 Serine-pyruvate aminotransferase/archaeal aspartate aminotransferase PucG [Methanonatronarchaeum thermophilum]